MDGFLLSVDMKAAVADTLRNTAPSSWSGLAH